MFNTPKLFVLNCSFVEKLTKLKKFKMYKLIKFRSDEYGYFVVKKDVNLKIKNKINNEFCMLCNSNIFEEYNKEVFFDDLIENYTYVVKWDRSEIDVIYCVNTKEWYI